MDSYAHSLKWDRRFLSLAELVAGWCNDEAEAEGCVLVDPWRRIRGVGYSGLPRGFSAITGCLSKENRDRLLVSAVENAILFSNADPKDCIAYTTGSLDAQAAGALCQAGIHSAVCASASAPVGKEGDVEIARRLMREAGISVRGDMEPLAHPQTVQDFNRLAKAACGQDRWDLRFLAVATLISSWSKDPSSQVGCVLVDAKRRIVSAGYNGFPKDASDALELYEDRKQKYPRVRHAEKNAIQFAGRNVEGATAYVTMPPCSRCAAFMINAGIARVVTIDVDEEKQARWQKDFDCSEWAFSWKGIQYTVMPLAMA